MENDLRILSLEDSAFDAELIEREVRNAKISFTMKRVETREDFVKAIDDFKPIVILLDYNLPSFDGISALDIAREKCPYIPAIFVSGAIGEERAVETLKRGAADYVMKDRLSRLAPAINRAIHEYEERKKLKQAEESLKESAQRFRAITETANDAIVCLEPPGVIYQWNKMAEEMFGYSAREAIGKDLHALIVPERYHEKAYQGIQSFSQTGKGAVIGKTTEMFALRKDGAEFPIELSISAMNINGCWQATGIIRDITQRKEAEVKLSHSYEKLRRTLEETATALSAALEMRDAYTAGHQRCVTQLASAISREMGLSEEQTNGIRIAGILHDIGKISIPAEILSKPGKLSTMEFELIKAHANAGYEILKGVEFPWPIAQFVLQHHEKMDGSGYPSGLSGDKILIEARILCVADVVDAMSSHRPYRAALGIDAAMEEIVQKSGILYDPVVVDVCVRLFREKGFKFE